MDGRAEATNASLTDNIGRVGLGGRHWEEISAFLLTAKP